MEKKYLKYGLKLDGRYAYGYEVFTYDQVRSLQMTFLGCAEHYLGEGDFDNASLFRRLADVFDLRIVND